MVCVGLSSQWHRNVSDLINSNRCRVEVCWYMWKYLIASLILIYSYVHYIHIYIYNCIFTLSASLLVWFNATKNNANRVLYLVEEIVVGKDVKSVLQTWPVVMCKVISKTWRLGRIIKSHIDFNFTEIFYHIWVLYQEVIFVFSVFRTLLDMLW